MGTRKNSLGGFLRVHTIYVFEQKQDNNVYSVNLSFVIEALPGLFSYLFYYIKAGFKGVKIIQVRFRNVASSNLF